MTSLSENPYISYGKKRNESHTNSGVVNSHLMSNNAVFPMTDGPKLDVEHYSTKHKPTRHPDNLQPTLRYNKLATPKPQEITKQTLLQRNSM